MFFLRGGFSPLEKNLFTEGVRQGKHKKTNKLANDFRFIK